MKKTAASVFTLTVLAAHFSAALAEEFITDTGEHIDITDWECKFCEFEEGFSGEVELGAGYVSDDSYKFGEYTGLNEEGAFPVGNASIRYRDDIDADYLNLSLRDAGLDSRSLRIEGGRQGTYDAFLFYQEIPHFLSDTAMTPYQGNGSENLSLPAAWVAAGSTAGMTALNASLRDVDLEVERKRFGVGLRFIPTAPWKYEVAVRRDTREGKMGTSGAFFFRGMNLVEPIDYETDQVDVSAAYRGKDWQATLHYYGSFFSNDNDSLIWQNAFAPIVPGATFGQRAQAPDNQFHQLQATAAYEITDATRLSGDIAVGRMTQDEDFLPATTNPNLNAGVLPANSLDGEVDTLTANLKVHSRPTDRLRVKGAWGYSDRDNNTPQNAYTWVSTDAFVNAPRTNLPYSFTRQEFKLDADYRIDNFTRLGAGFEHENIERTYLEAEETDEDTIWGELKVRARQNMDMTVKIARAERDVSDYQPVAEIDPDQNPLLRKYNMADRTRHSVRVIANASPSQRATVGVSFDFSTDEYTDSTVGLTDARDAAVSIDAGVQLTEDTSLHAFAGFERIRSRQSGSSIFAAPDWEARNDDTVNTAGIGARHTLIEDKLDIGADYILMRATGEISVDGSDFPDLENDRDTIKLYANYRLKETMSLHLAYWYEDYDVQNWSVDQVNPDTLPGVLTFGEENESYDVNVVTLSVRYKF
ncbi:MAG: MtrB/PioB family decaheme-associated outer membrane protein [Thiogranum sp.]|nr:MtrB/PioB family decaheme-associated outer membrane protein [Thiogranum sp.]